MAFRDPAAGKAYQKAWYLLNKERVKERVKARYAVSRDEILANARARYHNRYKDSKLAKLYGISKEEARKWLAVKACEICGSMVRRLTLDHDHSTVNQVRGRLCTNCNSGLGHFKDCPETLEAAAKYLRDRKETAS